MKASKAKTNRASSPTPPAQASPPATGLEGRLLALGGRSLDWPLLDAGLQEKLLARGERFDLPVLVEPGAEEARVAVATAWGRDYPEHLIATGCALTDEGEWVEHLWLLSAEKYPPDGRGQILETVKEMPMYFGYALSPRESLDFWVNHFLVPYGERPLRLFAPLGGLELLKAYGIFLDP